MAGPTTRQASYVRSLKKGGDHLAETIIDGAVNIKFTASTESGNVITVTGQTVDGAGNVTWGTRHVMFEVLNSTADALATVTTGTAIVGNGGNRVWLKTTATGKFVVNVGDSNAEDVLCIAQAENGQSCMKVLTFV